MSDERVPRRLGRARAGSKVALDPARLERLAGTVEARRRRWRLPRLALAGAAAAAAVVLLLVARGGIEHDGIAGSGGPAAAPPGHAPAGSGGGPRPALAPVPPPELVASAPERDRSPGPLEDLAADPARAQALWAGYQRSPDRHPTLPNVSHAGRRPDDPAPATIVNVRAEPFRAAGDGVTDDTEALRRAIAAVERRGGVVYLPDGDYLVSSILFVSANHTVLRGQSRDRTRLVFSRPLDVLLGPNVHGEHSRWQWSGGLVWFAAPDRRPSLQPGGARGWNGDKWAVGPEITRITAAVQRGDRHLQVASSAGLRAGALVFVGAEGQSEWLEPWPVEIAGIDGGRVTLRQPLRLALDPSDGARLLASREADLVRQSGIERMTLVMRRDRQWDQLGVGDVHGWNGVFFQGAVHGFAREIAVVDGHLAAGVSSSKNVSLGDITLRSTGLAERAPFPRGVAVRAWSHDVLIERVEVDPRYLFRLRIEGSGHAVSGVRGPLRWIGGPATDSVLTALTVLNPLPDGVAAPPGQRVAAWGIRYDRPDAPPAPPVTAEPANVYEAQKRLAR